MNKFSHGQFVIPVRGHPKIYMVMGQHHVDSETIDYNGNRRKTIKGYVDVLDLENSCYYDNIKPEGLKLWEESTPLESIQEHSTPSTKDT